MRPPISRNAPSSAVSSHPLNCRDEVTLSAAYSGCRSTEALYQPGPGETDRLSRTAHALLRRRGIEMLDPAIPLGAQHRPVLSVLSADVLE